MGPWLEFVDLEGVQYSLSCQAADWRKRLTCRNNTDSGATGRRVASPDSNDATERIARRLRSYQDPQPPPAIQNIVSPVPEVSTAILEDGDAFNHLLTANLDTLIQFTKIFAVRCSQHSALDNLFLELVPSLWCNVTKTDQLTAPCKSKVNPLHRCSGPAVLPVKVDRKERNELTFRRIEENRAEYKQVMIESLLPASPNICVAAVHTENAITQLIKHSQGTNVTSRCKHFRELACSLFFQLLSMMNEEVKAYPPTRQFFASCIEILGQHFVSQDSGQCQAVLHLCLNQPAQSGLASPHFVPNSCPTHLASMYGQLVHLLQEKDMELVFMLLTKFNISEWLLTYNPGEGERKQLIESLAAAMMACGPDLSGKCELVHGLYLAHMAALLKSRFPSNLCSILHMIIQGSASERIHRSVWETLLDTCFTNDMLHTSDRASDTGQCDSVFEARKVEDCVDNPMSTAQVKELMDWLSSYFMHAKVTRSSQSTFGLYSHWSRYVTYISLLLGTLAQSFITKIIKGSDDMQPSQVLELVWQPVISLYAPWLQPLMGQSQGNSQVAQLHAPWLEADVAMADVMAGSMQRVVMHLYSQMHEKNEMSSPGVLSMTLMYYLSSLCTVHTPACVSDVFLAQLGQLPWQHLWPDLQLLESCVMLREKASPCCFALIGHILPQVQWREVIIQMTQQPQSDLSSRLLVSLAVLLVQAYGQPRLREKESMSLLLSQSLTFDWSQVTQDGFSCICSWFMEAGEPRCVLAQRSSSLALGLRLLKEISGFSPNIQWTHIVSMKRIHYVHVYTQQLCQVTYLSDITSESVVTAIVNLMSDVEAVESGIPVAEWQDEESLQLLKEILSLLNNSNPSGPWLREILSSLTGWLTDSPHSLLLDPYIKVASSAVASLNHMAALVEAAIEAYFSGCDDDSRRRVVGERVTGWSYILSVFTVPELNQAELVQAALEENSFLVLYAFLQHRLPFCQTQEEDLGLIDAILDWTNRATASEENDSKLVLWYHMLLWLVLRQINTWTTEVAKRLTRFLTYLHSVGQDRASGGLLGAIGLGRRSPLSLKMRLLARLLAAFLTCQFVKCETVRTKPQINRSPTVNTTVSELKTLRKNKNFSSFLSTVDSVLLFVQDGSYTICDCLKVLSLVVKDLSPDKQYLNGMKLSINC